MWLATRMTTSPSRNPSIHPNSRSRPRGGEEKNARRLAWERSPLSLSLSLSRWRLARALRASERTSSSMPPLPVVRFPLPPSAAHAAPKARWPRALRHRGGGGIEARGDGRGRGRRGVVCAMAAGEAGAGPGPAPSRTQVSQRPVLAFALFFRVAALGLRPPLGIGVRWRHDGKWGSERC